MLTGSERGRVLRTFVHVLPARPGAARERDVDVTRGERLGTERVDPRAALCIIPCVCGTHRRTERACTPAIRRERRAKQRVRRAGEHRACGEHGRFEQIFLTKQHAGTTERAAPSLCSDVARMSARLSEKELFELNAKAAYVV